MTAVNTPQDLEKKRVAALRKLNVLDSPYEALFDAIALTASEVCETPIALITLVDAQRQWFKANVGMPGIQETPREGGLCNTAIQHEGLTEVSDASDDPQFCGHPFVTQAAGLRFYAGAPICLPLGEKIGTVCVIDREPRQLNASQRKALQGLANIAGKALMARKVMLNQP